MPEYLETQHQTCIPESWVSFLNPTYNNGERGRKDLPKINIKQKNI
jgi:hypothetical protein